MTEPSRPPPLVLIVEDHADTRAMLSFWFQHCGCRVMEAANGVDALSRVSESRPDAIITDVVLPGAIDGYEFCRRIRENPVTRTIPLIAATGWAQPEHIDRARQAGCDRVFIKPYSPIELSDEVFRFVPPARGHHEDALPSGFTL
jgi:CheY-like chemotaxis protein